MWTAVVHGSGGLSGRQKPLKREGAVVSLVASWRLQSTKEKMDQQSSPDLRGQGCGNAFRRARGRSSVTQEELSSLLDGQTKAINVTSGGVVAWSPAELRNNVQWVSRFTKAKPG